MRRMSCRSWTILKFFDMMVMMMEVMMIMVVITMMIKVMMLMMINLLPIERQNFVLPQLPLIIPEPETPAPNDRISVEYLNIFVTDDMIGNSVLGSNKYGIKKTGSCPNFTKAELQTYIGMYNLMGSVKLPKIDDCWRFDLHYGQIADKMSRNSFRLVHRIDLFGMMCTLYKRQIKSRRWHSNIFHHSLTMVTTNGWFLHRRESKSLKNNQPLQIKNFKSKLLPL